MNEPCQDAIELLDEDLRAALKDIKTYVDVTEEDLREIYQIALRHAHRRAAGNAPVREVMTCHVVAISPDADVREAAKILSDNAISGAPVVDEQGIVVGVVSDADLLHLAGLRRGHTFSDMLRHLLGGGAPKFAVEGCVRDIMSHPAVTVSPDTSIRAAAAILDERRIRRLPIVDECNRPVGIVSRGDIVRVMGE